ncbi:hypothetical protein AVEN_150371-1 [Araneus ventricosus]|uniref:Uncharacterized protein n=1 Tax=Araneus ventricosus TaxID=182803 RepID=A0A4Y2CRV6_ARAVE|nr:hypothetical protein AVEN_150371-1 [Araneus ventricosus]
MVFESNRENEEKTVIYSKELPSLRVRSLPLSSTSSAALQAILGLPPLYLLLQYEARLTTLYRLQLLIPPNISSIQPQYLERKATGWSTHPSFHLHPTQVLLETTILTIALI